MKKEDQTKVQWYLRELDKIFFVEKPKEIISSLPTKETIDFIEQRKSQLEEAFKTKGLPFHDYTKQRNKFSR